MQQDTDLVETLLKTAGRRIEPPDGSREQVLVAAHAAFRRKSSHRQERRRLLWAGAAAAMVAGVALVLRFTSPVAEGGELARVERFTGGVEVATGDTWMPVAEGRASMGTGRRLRTRADGRVAVALVVGGSLRLAGDTEIMFDAPGRLYVKRGTIYVDSGPGPDAARLEVVTPAGTARDLGTQFELQVAGAALRLRVREGSVSIDRGGQSLTGGAGDQIVFDVLGGMSRDFVESDSMVWQWAELIAPTPDMDGKPAAGLIAWVARETGRRLRYVSPGAEQRAATVILHGNIRNLAPLAALEAMLATTDLEYAVKGDTMEVRTRDTPPLDP